MTEGRIYLDGKDITDVNPRECDMGMVFQQYSLFYGGNIEQSAKPVELYRNPATVFAASFIGNYNLLSKEQFAGLTRENVKCKQAAIRPEMIFLAGECDTADTGKVAENEENVQEAVYRIDGIVENGVPHGNVLRYTVAIGKQKLNVDVLFSGRCGL